MVRRLAGPKQPPQTQSLHHKKAGPSLPGQDAPGIRSKKNPGLGTVAQVCAAWIEAHPHTYSSRRAARDLAAICGNATPHQITPLQLQSLIHKWRADYSHATAHQFGNGLRRLIRNIGQSINRPELESEIPHVTMPRPRGTIAAPDQLAALVAAAPTWLRVIILLAAHAGFRRGDCLRIAPEHYNAEKRTIAIHQQKTKARIEVPVTEELAKLLEAAPEGSPATPFYELHRGAPITAGGLDKAWHALKKKTGVDKNLWIHDLRRTLAVSLYEISKDLRVVEQMLGHQSLRSTTAYLEHRDPAKLRPYLESLFIPKGRVQ